MAPADRGGCDCTTARGVPKRGYGKAEAKRAVKALRQRGKHAYHYPCPEGPGFHVSTEGHGRTWRSTRYPPGSRRNGAS